MNHDKIRTIRSLAGVVILLFAVISGLCGFFIPILTVDLKNYLLSMSCNLLIAGLVLLFLENSIFKHNDQITDEMEALRTLYSNIGAISSDTFQTLIPISCKEKRLFHTYHLTSRDSRHVWMYNPVVLGPDLTQSKLEGTRDTINLRNEENSFKLSAGIRGTNLVIFATKGDEAGVDHVIDVIHDFKNPNNTSYFGFRFHATWDKNHSISPVIFASNKLIPNRRIRPFVVSENDSLTLSSKYIELARKHRISPLLCDLFNLADE